jgi:acid phosphatase family membrane protein YuiD
MQSLKLLLSITLIYILRALTFGIETAFIALMCVIASIVLILAISVRRSAASVRDSFYSVDPNEHYY